jgi:hypothetical protein
MLGLKHSEETKRKMSNKRKGKNNAMYGKKHSEATKNKIKLSHSGEKCWAFGVKFSEDHKNKISKSQINKIITKEHSQKISKTIKEKEICKGTNNPNNKYEYSLSNNQNFWNLNTQTKNIIGTMFRRKNTNKINYKNIIITRTLRK